MPTLRTTIMGLLLSLVALGATAPVQAGTAGPTARGTIGVSLVIPPRIRLDHTADAGLCNRTRSSGSVQLRIVDEQGTTLPTCDATAATRVQRQTGGARSVLVSPV